MGQVIFGVDFNRPKRRTIRTGFPSPIEIMALELLKDDAFKLHGTEPGKDSAWAFD